MSSEPKPPSQNLQPAGTPLVRKTSSNTVPQPPDHIEVKEQMARDVAEEIVGGMPYPEFLDSFMKLDKTKLLKVKKDLKKVRNNHFSQIPADGAEKHMYDKLINCIEAAKLLPNFDVLNTSSHADRNSRTDRKWRPDVSVYKKTGPRKPVTEIMKFDKLELPIELKPRWGDRPFEDRPDAVKAAGYIYLPDKGAENRGQLVAVLTELFARQFRTHAFMIFVDSQDVRFIRADRCGLVVTKAIKYRTNSHALAEFFLRFNELTDAERGWDPTVKLATAAVATMAREKLAFHCKKTGTYLGGWERPVVVITVPGGKGGKDRHVYGWHSFSDAESLTGRGTRGYPVYDPTDEKVYFLKDMWRSEHLEPEYVILQYLNEKQVPHIPKVVAGGDLAGEIHRTQTQSYVDRSWQLSTVGSEGYDGLDLRVHHRLLEDLVDGRIWDCSNAHNMMTLIQHAFIAHEAAYNVGYLHRDISDNNVMVVVDHGKPVEGILADWDLALKVKDENGNWIKEQNRRQRCRTGTWYFMSSRLLDTPSQRHVLSDDLESFFYLVFFLSLCLFETNLPDRRQLIFSKVFAEGEYDPEQKAYVGGGYKELLITKGKLLLKPDLIFTGNDGLTSWINTVRLALKSFYDLDPATLDLVATIEELSITDPLYIHKESWDQLLVKDHGTIMNAFQETLLNATWSEAKPGDSPFERAPRTRAAKQSVGDGASSKNKSKSFSGSGGGQRVAIRSSSSLQVPDPASGSSQYRRSPRFAAKQPEDRVDGTTEDGFSGSNKLPSSSSLEVPKSGPSGQRHSPRFTTKQRQDPVDGSTDVFSPSNSGQSAVLPSSSSLEVPKSGSSGNRRSPRFPAPRAG